MRSSAKTKARNKGGGKPPTPPPVPNYTLTVDLLGAGGGTVTGPGIDSATSDLAQAYPSGTSVTLTATPDASSDFTAWTGGITSTASPVTFTVSADMTVHATFAAITGGGGSNPDDTGVPAIDSHMGAIKKQDLATAQDFCPGLWIKSTTPYVDGPYTTAKPISGDTWITWLNTAPVDSHVARGQTTTSARFRRLKADETVQDVFDAGKNASTRTQMVNNSTTNTFWPGVDGTRYWYMFSHRRHGAGQLGTNPVQVCQWKAPVSSGGTTQPILAINELGSGYQFLWHDWNAGTKQAYPMNFASNNVWIRFWVDIKWSATSSSASFSVWSDMNGWPPTRMTGFPVTGKKTLFVSSEASNWSVGMYASPASDLNGILLSDYANFQVCAYI